MRKSIGFLIAFGFLFVHLTLIPAYADEKAVKQAVSASDAWLRLLDTGKYGDSWETAAGYFKHAMEKDRWAREIRSIRIMMGRFLKRKLKSAQFSTTLPGAPDGEYVVIQYETSFTGKKNAIETVTPMRENDGTWRVTGYYIK